MRKFWWWCIDNDFPIVAIYGLFCFVVGFVFAWMVGK